MAVRACTKLESQQIGRICDQIEPNIRSMIEAGLEPLHVASALSYLTALVTVGNEFDFDEETWHLQGPELDVLCEELAECLDRSITRITRRN